MASATVSALLNVGINRLANGSMAYYPVTLTRYPVTLIRPSRWS